MTRRQLNYGRHQIGDDDIQAVVDVLRGDLITQGPVVDRFEHALAERVGARHVIAVSSGTAALHIACLAAGMTTGDRGVTSTLTFVASANAFHYCGGTADVVDADPDTLGMDAAALSRYLQAHPETGIVTPVHFAGLSGDMSALRAAAGDRCLVEDAAHALGGVDPAGNPVGACVHSDISVFSFHPVKSITTGEGGAVTTNDPELARLLRLYRTHGIERSADRMANDAQAFENGVKRSWYMEQQLLGYNYRITDIQAALGLSQLTKLDSFVARRREIAAFYDAEFSGLAHLSIPQSDPLMRSRSALHLYVVTIDFAALGTTRQGFINDLQRMGIAPQVHYIPVHKHPYHADRLRPGPDDFPVVDRFYETCLSLPLFPGMTDEEAAYVAASVRSLLRP